MKVDEQEDEKGDEKGKKRKERRKGSVLPHSTTVRVTVSPFRMVPSVTVTHRDNSMESTRFDHATPMKGRPSTQRFCPQLAQSTQTFDSYTQV